MATKGTVSGVIANMVTLTVDGPANVFKYERGTEEVLISTNREIDEVAMYTFEK